MSRYFTTLLDTGEVDACFLPEDEKSSSDSDEIDSDVEFHLYSQLHYSSHLNDKDLQSDGFSPDCDVTSSDDDAVDACANESSLQKASLTDGKKVGPFDREDIERLKKFLSDDEEDFVPESWEIVDSIGSDDEGVDIHINADSITEEEIEELDTSVEVSEDLWKVDERDRAGVKAERKGRYYSDETTSRVRCKNCDEIGHLARNCPAEKKKPVCFMCGNRGHIVKECPEWQNQRFTNHRAVCNRCGQEGHIQKDCPDLWRQFHLTTEIGPIVLPEIETEVTENVQCPNCAGNGHFVAECTQDRGYYNRVVQSPFIYYYDENAVVKPASDYRKHEQQGRQKSKGTPYAGRKSISSKKSQHTVFTSSPEHNKKHHRSLSQHKKQPKNHHSESRSRHCDYDKSYHDNRTRKERTPHKKQHSKRSWSESRDFNDDFGSNKQEFKRPKKGLTKREQLLRLMNAEKSRTQNEQLRNRRSNLTNVERPGSSNTSEIVRHNSRNVVFREPVTPPFSKNGLFDTERPFPRTKNDLKKGGYKQTSGQRNSSQKFDRGFKRKYR